MTYYSLCPFGLQRVVSLLCAVSRFHSECCNRASSWCFPSHVSIYVVHEVVKVLSAVLSSVWPDWELDSVDLSSWQAPAQPTNSWKKTINSKKYQTPLLPPNLRPNAIDQLTKPIHGMLCTEFTNQFNNIYGHRFVFTKNACGCAQKSSHSPLRHIFTHIQYGPLFGKNDQVPAAKTNCRF